MLSIPAIATAIGTALSEIFKALPKKFWYFMFGAVIGGVLSLYVAGVWVTGDWMPGSVPTVQKKEKVTPDKRKPSAWENLDIYEPPKDSVIIRDTVRITETVREGPENGLTRATYDTELLQRPRLTKSLSYAVIPFRNGSRPDVTVSPDRVSLRLVNPRTAGYMDYSYKVPSETWEITASLSLAYTHWRDSRGRVRPVVNPSLAINVSRKIGDYLLTGSGVLKTGQTWWGAQVTIERPLWSR